MNPKLADDTYTDTYKSKYKQNEINLKYTTTYLAINSNAVQTTFFTHLYEYVFMKTAALNTLQPSGYFSHECINYYDIIIIITEIGSQTHNIVLIYRRKRIFRPKPKQFDFVLRPSRVSR